jgi:CheY-like chemotaxis protein
MEMALLNLAINARDAMPEGGTLTIAISDRSVCEETDLVPGRYVEIRVTDTGTGMPASVAARAFEPFFTTKGVGQGTGLGLSQVYAMARQAGGTARIERNQPCGTTVLVWMPFVEIPSKARPTSADPVPSGTYEARVLVVDDDPDVRLFLGASLEALGFVVVLAEDGQSGLDVLDAADPDLVLVDFAMPGMNGAQMAKLVRARRPSLPIVFATGYSETAAIMDAVGTSAVLLKKPFAVSDLETVLRTALEAR